MDFCYVSKMLLESLASRLNMVLKEGWFLPLEVVLGWVFRRHSLPPIYIFWVKLLIKISYISMM